MSLVIGIDVATAEVRAVAADADGRIRAEGHSPLPEPKSPRPGWVEQDASAWWPTVVEVLSQLTDRLGDAARAVGALSVCATSGTVVAIDGSGDAMGSALMYSDQRAASEADVAQAAARERWKTLGLRVGATFGLPKWSWLVRNGQLGADVAGLAHASDVVVSHLVGGRVPTDWSHALKSGYDPLRGEWVAEAMEALDVPLHLLPDVRRPTESAGRLSEEAAAATGLPGRCDVRLGMTDACASQLAAGASSPGQFVSVLGSTLVLKGASLELVTDPSGAVYSHRHPQGWWLPGGASNTGARALKEQFGDEDLARLDAAAAEHGPAHGVVYPLVGRGERFPFTAPDAEEFVVEEPADDVDRYRAMLEGVAFVERLGFERLASLGATAQPPIAATGGGSTSEVWNRIRATVLGVPVVEKAPATTALGACILAASGTLHPDLSAATEAMAVEGTEVSPHDDERDVLEQNYQRFVDAVTDRGWLPEEPS